MTQPPDDRPKHIIDLGDAKLEVTMEPIVPVYSVNLVTSYNLPVITVYFQANPLLQPVEVAHIYLQPDTGDDMKHIKRAWMNDFTNAYVASIAYGLAGGIWDNDQAFALHVTDTTEAERAKPLDTAKPSVSTFVLAVPEVEARHQNDEPTVYAFVQLFQPAPDPDVEVPSALKGYDPVFVVDAICAITDIPDTRNRPAYVPPAQSLKELLEIADREMYFADLAVVEHFNPPHTAALGNWMIADNSRIGAKVLGFPDGRDAIKAAKKKAGIKEKPTVSQLG